MFHDDVFFCRGTGRGGSGGGLMKVGFVMMAENLVVELGRIDSFGVPFSGLAGGAAA